MMYRNQIVVLAGVLGSLVCITGCVDQSYKMIGRECPQVAKYEPPHAITKNYIQSVTLYEGYQTRAHFDVLVMAPEMRVIVAELLSTRMGHTPTQAAACLKQGLALNNDHIELYVLSQINNPAHVSLSDPNSVWSLFITTPSGMRLQPLEIKEVTLSPEISALFGHRHLGFKTATRIVFPALDLAGRRYINPENTATITFSGVGMSSSLTWTEKKTTNIKSLELIRQDNKSLWQMVKELTQPKERDEDYYFC